MKYLSLFSGVGGFELGISKACPEWHCLGYSEINREAIEIYSKHFPSHHNFGDIKEIDECSLPKVELLVGGFPCQSYSIAGKRNGLDDSRGELFFDILRILKAVQPEVIFLENVKGLTNHEDGFTYWFIIEKLEEIGYHVDSEVLNSKHFGVHQNRERVYFVGFKDVERFNRFQFPQKTKTSWDFHEILEETPPEEVYLRPDQIRKMKGFGSKNAFGGYLSNSKVYNCLTAGYSVDGGNSMKFFRNGRLSALSPLECERLQGFPDNWTLGLSTRHRYRTMGNAVTTNVIAAIAGQIKKVI